MPTWLTTMPSEQALLTVSLIANLLFGVALIVSHFHLGAKVKDLLHLHTTNATAINNVALAPVPQEQIDAAVKKALDERMGLKSAKPEPKPWDKS